MDELIGLNVKLWGLDPAWSFASTILDQTNITGLFAFILEHDSFSALLTYWDVLEVNHGFKLDVWARFESTEAQLEGTSVSLSHDLNTIFEVTKGGGLELYVNFHGETCCNSALVLILASEASILWLSKFYSAYLLRDITNSNRHFIVLVGLDVFEKDSRREHFNALVAVDQVVRGRVV
jgi:hypothetical protein